MVDDRINVEVNDSKTNQNMAGALKCSKYFRTKLGAEPSVHFYARKKHHISSALASSKSTETNIPVCAICLEGIMAPSNIDGCCHVFCFDCICTWGRVTHKCPMCKANFTKVTEAGYLKRIQLFTDINDDASNSADFERLERLPNDRGNDNLYGYEDDGFVVEDEVIEYSQSDADITEVGDILDHCEQLLERARIDRKRKREESSLRQSSPICIDAGRGDFASYLQSFTYVDS